MEKMYLNTKDVCKFLDISISKLYKMTYKNEIPVYRFGRLLKFKKTDLIQFVETKQMLQTEPIEIGRLESLRIPSLAA